MLSRTKISKCNSTVIPAEIRHAIGLEHGDILEWDLKGDLILIKPRKKVTLEDIIGFCDEGGDAVEAKKRIQRGGK
jgi:AbrB family looped-hinge helix DNA binding protein